jgi:HD-GYP domain-containing protein (c-di-GMP phosphodiesterase class II)
MSDTIDVEKLRVGMYIHLDLGWTAHPFPLSSFKLTAADQIATIRSLGLVRVRWSPDKSEPVDAAAEAPLPAPAAAPVLSAADIERAQRRQALADQRVARQLCERQYGEAGKSLRQINEAAATDPRLAGERAQALTRALVDKMLSARETSIRVVTEGAGDRATAHGLNVAIVSLLTGRLFGLSEVDLMDLGIGALMHDVGKLQLPDRVRFATDQFTTAEQSLYREHVAHGVTQGRKMGLSPGALLVIAQHHEHADGSGFPQKLALERLSMPARLVALINRYDNLCNPAQLSLTLTPHEALSMLFAKGKNKYDALMLNAFIRMMGVYPPGSVVQLTDDRYAMVMSVNSSRPLKPRVLVHDPKVPRDEALYIDLESHPTLGIRRSIKPALLPRPALDYLAPGQRIAYFFEPAVSLDEPVPAEAVL